MLDPDEGPQALALGPDPENGVLQMRVAGDILCHAAVPPFKAPWSILSRIARCALQRSHRITSLRQRPFSFPFLLLRRSDSGSPKGACYRSIESKNPIRSFVGGDGSRGAAILDTPRRAACDERSNGPSTVSLAGAGYEKQRLP